MSQNLSSAAVMIGALRVNPLKRQLQCSEERDMLSGRVFNWRSRGCGFEPHQKHCIVALSKTLYPLLSNDSTQEDPSQHNLKIC